MSQTGLVRKLFNEEELLDLFNNDTNIFKSKPNKNSKSVYLEMDEEDENDEEEGGEITAQEAFEELDLDSMSDSEKISLAHEILSKCKDIDCSDIMSSLEELAGEKDSDSDEEDEEDEED